MKPDYFSKKATDIANQVKIIMKPENEKDELDDKSGAAIIFHHADDLLGTKFTQQLGYPPIPVDLDSDAADLVGPHAKDNIEDYVDEMILTPAQLQAKKKALAEKDPVDDIVPKPTPPPIKFVHYNPTSNKGRPETVKSLPPRDWAIRQREKARLHRAAARASKGLPPLPEDVVPITFVRSLNDDSVFDSPPYLAPGPAPTPDPSNISVRKFRAGTLTATQDSHATHAARARRAKELLQQHKQRQAAAQHQQRTRAPIPPPRRTQIVAETPDQHARENAGEAPTPQPIATLMKPQPTPMITPHVLQV